MRALRRDTLRCAALNAVMIVWLATLSSGLLTQMLAIALPGTDEEEICPPAPTQCADHAQAWEGDRLTLYVFLDSAEQLRRGRPIYDRIRMIQTPDGPTPALPNLNHPFVALAAVPFTLVARPTAFLLWTALSLLAYLTAVILIFRETGLSFPRRYSPAVGSLILTYPGVIYSLQAGQLGLFLSLPVALVWLLLRRGQLRRAALVLGILVALKPFLGVLLPLLLIRRRWSAIPAIAAGALLISLIPLPFVGLHAYGAWLATLGTITWYDHPLNLSVTGWLFRFFDPDPPGWITWAATGWALFLALIVIAPPFGPRRYVSAERRAMRAHPVAPPRRERRLGYELRRLDRDFGVLIILAILGSPLGWLYYTPMILPALATRAGVWRDLPRKHQLSTALALLCLWSPHFLPALLPPFRLVQLTLGATGTYGLVLLAISLWVAPNPNLVPLAAPTHEGAAVPQALVAASGD